MTSRLPSLVRGPESRGKKLPDKFWVLLSVPTISLAEGFEEDDAGGYRDIQRFHGAGGGQRNHKVTAFAG
jgi:hypothetical protein